MTLSVGAIPLQAPALMGPSEPVTCTDGVPMRVGVSVHLRVVANRSEPNPSPPPTSADERRRAHEATHLKGASST